MRKMLAMVSCMVLVFGMCACDAASVNGNLTKLNEQPAMNGSEVKEPAQLEQNIEIPSEEVAKESKIETPAEEALKETTIEAPTEISKESDMEAPNVESPTEKVLKEPKAETSSKEVPSEPAKETSKQNYIGIEEAKNVAAKHGGFELASVKALEAEFDFDDRVPVYELEFLNGRDEYEYEVHAESGKILKAEKNDRDLLKAEEATKPSLKSKEEAKQIALTHVGVTESEVQRIKVELDKDDDRTEYDVEFYIGQVEYEFEINAVTGKVISFEKDK